ncbi:complex 1 protein-domain-containing protein [Exophiala viscosa]|uniref:Complex 1 protein-domain-containing protein n=1 Tax=Exophiala viscosa TaxID=2486360 RepID=A0AAN6DYF0_9EURO|nr:complex 1 protein-domain-containing protein [Exophiala viscosa]KAI1621549.1 complex 1 protein-domain-containing protein [Exophiala viscosa]
MPSKGSFLTSATFTTGSGTLQESHTMRYSGLQREVFKLYRQCLRAASRKPETSRQHFREAAQREFRRNQDVDKKDFSAIEALLRMGSRKLELYSSPGVRDIH